MGWRYPMVAAFDLLACLLIVFLLSQNPKAKAETRSIDTLGWYAIDVTWPSGLDDDIDTWTQDPLGNLCWYRSTTAGLLNLQRDDLGILNDTIAGPHGQAVTVQTNAERTILRGIVPGEYTVNVHFFARRDGRTGPVPVTVTLTRLHGPDKQVIHRVVLLRAEGDERTAFRFSLNAAGTVTGSNDLQKRFVGTSSP